MCVRERGVCFIGVVNLAAGVVFISIFASCLANGADVTVTTTQTHTHKYIYIYMKEDTQRRCRLRETYSQTHTHTGYFTLFI